MVSILSSQVTNQIQAIAEVKRFKIYGQELKTLKIDCNMTRHKGRYRLPSLLVTNQDEGSFQESLVANAQFVFSWVGEHLIRRQSRDEKTYHFLQIDHSQYRAASTSLDKTLFWYDKTSI